MATLYIRTSRIMKLNQEFIISVKSSDGETWDSLEDFYEDFPFGKGGRSWDRVILSGAIILPERRAKSWKEDGTWLRFTYSDDQGHEKRLVVGGQKGTRRLSLDPREAEMPRYDGGRLYEFTCEGDSVEEIVQLLDMDE